MKQTRTAFRDVGIAIAASCVLAALVLASACASSGSVARAKERKGPLHHYQLSRMYFEQGKIPEALEEIDISLRMDGSLPQAHFYKGYIYWSLERWPEAAEAFESALSLHEYYSDARLYLSTCYERLGRTDAALEQLDVAQRDRTYQFPEKVELNRALILVRQGRSGDALSSLRRAVEMRPRYYRAHYEMAQVLEALRRGDEAITAYDAAMPGYIKDAEFRYRRGAALFRLDRRLEAARELRRAMELAPGSETASRARDLLDVIG